MATTPVEFVAPTGLTLTADVYPLGSDTAAASGKAATERTNNKGVYRFDVTELLSGWHRVEILSGTVTIAVFDVLLADDTADHYAHDRAVEALHPATAGRELNVAADGDIGGNVDGSVGSVVGHTPQTGDSYARIGAAGAGLTDLGGMSVGMKAEVNAEADTALTDYAPNTTTPPTAAAIADQVWDEATAGHATAGTTAKALTDTLADTADMQPKIGSPAADLSADIAAVKTDTGNLVTRITAALFSGITSLAEWLGLLGGKQIGDATALAELKATGAGSGTYDPTTDSLEAVRDRADAIHTLAAAVDTLTKAAGAGDLAAVKTAADAIKVQTDKLTFTVANELDANIQSINDVTITGDGSATPFNVV